MTFTKAKCLGYAVVIIASLFYCGQIITAQVLGRTYPTFQLNLIRFMAHTFVSLFVVIILKQDVFTLKEQRDAWIIFGSSTAFTWLMFSLCLAPLYGPVGSLESVAITVFILLNVLCAILRRYATFAIVLAAVISCTGVVCLTQPAFLFGQGSNPEILDMDPCPCSGLQGDSASDRIPQCLVKSVDIYLSDIYEGTVNNIEYMPYVNGSHLQNDFLVDTNGTEHLNFKTNNSGVNKNQNETLTPTAPSLITMGMKRETFGYLLMVTCGVAFFITVQVNANVLLPRYHFSVLTFWYGVIGVLYSLVFLFVQEAPRFVGGPMCLSILGVHTLFASFTFLLTNISLTYITAEENAILNTTGIVLLFIAQSTFLIDFHPPKGNAVECIGAVLIIGACLCEPVVTLIKDKFETKPYEYKKVNDDVENVDDVNEKTFLLISRYPTENGLKYSAK